MTQVGFLSSNVCGRTHVEDLSMPSKFMGIWIESETTNCLLAPRLLFHHRPKPLTRSEPNHHYSRPQMRTLTRIVRMRGSAKDRQKCEGSSRCQLHTVSHPDETNVRLEYSQAPVRPSDSAASSVKALLAAVHERPKVPRRNFTATNHVHGKNTTSSSSQISRNA